MAQEQLVNFGKYKSKPVKFLLQDNNYCQWVVLQTWFAEKHPDLYNIIKFSNVSITINNNSLDFKDEPTPEHNKLQAKFLDSEFRSKFVNGLFHHEYNLINIISCEFEKVSDICMSIDVGNTRDSYSNITIFIEIKPSVGDDYPAVLRQINHQKQAAVKMLYGGPSVAIDYTANLNFYLLIGNFESQAITKDQLVEYFAASHIKVLFSDEI